MKDVQDPGVTATISQIGRTNQFRVEVSYKGKRDMTWWASASAHIYDSRGRAVPSPVGAKGHPWFTWKEDARTVIDKGDFVDLPSHFGAFRRDNPLVKTLVLDGRGLPPGRYRVVPSVTVFQRGKDAHPAMKDAFYANEMGVIPAEVKSCRISVR